MPKSRPKKVAKNAARKVEKSLFLNLSWCCLETGLVSSELTFINFTGCILRPVLLSVLQQGNDEAGWNRVVQRVGGNDDRVHQALHEGQRDVAHSRLLLQVCRTGAYTINISGLLNPKKLGNFKN